MDQNRVDSDESVQFNPDTDHEELPLGLGTLANLTGINVSHLKRMYNGEIQPNSAHLERIEEVVGSRLTKRFDRHARSIPEFVRTDIGKVPHGHTLKTLPVSTLESGDLIAYDRPSRGRGDQVVQSNNSWVKVISQEFINDQRVEIVLDGGVSFQSYPFLLAQVARPD